MNHAEHKLQKNQSTRNLTNSLNIITNSLNINIMIVAAKKLLAGQSLLRRHPAQKIQTIATHIQ